jgi:malate dehydrogenase (oxaloacetate-decarboxylating)
MPADVLAWSKGTALVASGIPVSPIEYGDITYTIGQANNFLVFPGLGLGVIVAGANRVTKAMLPAAAHAIAQQADVSSFGAALLPDVKSSAHSRRSSPKPCTPLRSPTAWPP